jgi:hypothetical protein
MSEERLCRDERIDAAAGISPWRSREIEQERP